MKKEEIKKEEIGKENNITEAVFILDKSGSMAGMESDTIGGFNSLIEKQRRSGSDVLVTTILFSNDSKTLHDRIRVDKVGKMTERQYSVGGCTALLDAIGGAICHIKDVHRYIRPEDVPAHTVFFITTDGLENASREFTSDSVKKMIEEQKSKEGWEFVFIAADIDAVQTAGSIGIAPERAMSYKKSRKGTANLYRCMSEALDCVASGKQIDSNVAGILSEDD
ncbi:MAG: VWA domain-containing protein [Clostridia bacterium]|nr:VWA domain-containing protein [Clostridia bacterium]